MILGRIGRVITPIVKPSIGAGGDLTGCQWAFLELTNLSLGGDPDVRCCTTVSYKRQAGCRTYTRLSRAPVAYPLAIDVARLIIQFTVPLRCHGPNWDGPPASVRCAVWGPLRQ